MLNEPATGPLPERAPCPGLPPEGPAGGQAALLPQHPLLGISTVLLTRSIARSHPRWEHGAGAGSTAPTPRSLPPLSPLFLEAARRAAGHLI